MNFKLDGDVGGYCVFSRQTQGFCLAELNPNNIRQITNKSPPPVETNHASAFFWTTLENSRFGVLDFEELTVFFSFQSRFWEGFGELTAVGRSSITDDLDLLAGGNEGKLWTQMSVSPTLGLSSQDAQVLTKHRNVAPQP